MFAPTALPVNSHSIAPGRTLPPKPRGRSQRADPCRTPPAVYAPTPGYLPGPMAGNELRDVRPTRPARPTDHEYTPLCGTTTCPPCTASGDTGHPHCTGCLSSLRPPHPHPTHGTCPGFYHGLPPASSRSVSRPYHWNNLAPSLTTPSSFPPSGHSGPPPSPPDPRLYPDALYLHDRRPLEPVPCPWYPRTDAQPCPTCTDGRRRLWNSWDGCVGELNRRT